LFKNISGLTPLLQLLPVNNVPSLIKYFIKQIQKNLCLPISTLSHMILWMDLRSLIPILLLEVFSPSGHSIKANSLQLLSVIKLMLFLPFMDQEPQSYFSIDPKTKFKN
jgi:hypothetical protein